ncbi:unnamed protein product, partial [Meganyctiphanes norvegica]
HHHQQQHQQQEYRQHQQYQQQQQSQHHNSAPSSPQVSGQHRNNYTPTKIANLLSRKLTKITRSPKLDKEKKSLKNEDNELENKVQLQESQEITARLSFDIVGDTSLGLSQCSTPLGTPATMPKHQQVTPQHNRAMLLRNAERSEIVNTNKEYRRTENMLKIWILEVKG